jgi:hypothetical protein
MFRSPLRSKLFGNTTRKPKTAHRFSPLRVETLEDRSVPAAFTPGNLVILRIGDGATALSTAAAPGAIVELTTNGSNPTGGTNVVNLPTSATSNGGGVTFAGNSTSSGGLSLSQNGAFLTAAGYDSPVGTPSVAGSPDNRNIVQIDMSASVSIPVVLNNPTLTGSNNTARDAVTTNGTDFWLVGAAGPFYAQANPAVQTGTAIQTSGANTRNVGIVGGNLVITTQSTVSRYTGVPTAAASATTLGVSPAPANAQQFVFLDRQFGVGDANLGGSVDTLYIGSTTGSSLLKYYYNGSNWTAAGSATVTNGIFGLTGTVNGSDASLFATVGTGSNNSLQSFTDTAAYNATINGSFTSLATAGTNYSFRGIVLLPGSNSAPTLNGANNLDAITQDIPNNQNNGTLVSSLIAGQVTDPNANSQGIAVTGVVTTNGTWEYTVDGGANWNSLAAVSVSSARLLTANTLTKIRFVPNAGFVGTVNGLTFRAWDQTSGAVDTLADTTTNGGSTAFSTATATSSVQVTAATVTTTTLSAQTLTVNSGQTVTFSGTVIPATGPVTPTGTVEIRNGGAAGTLLATTTVISGGTGAFNIPTSTIPPGVYSAIEAFFIPTPGSGLQPSSSSSGTSVTVNNFRSISSSLPVTENFDGLAAVGVSSTLPGGFYFVETGTNANTTYAAGDGSLGTGNTYSFGTGAETDRALGGLQSGSLVPTIGAAFSNDTGGIITSLTVAYTGEQWRTGALTRPDQLDFQISFDATSLTTGTWTDVDALDFVSPIQTGSGALNGNDPANRLALSSTISNLIVPANSVFWIRWQDFNAVSTDDGLGVDDFSITAVSATGTATTTTLDAPSPSSVSFGQQLTFTGLVTPNSGSAIPTGTIEIRDGGSGGPILASGAVNPLTGAFNISTSSVGVGSYTNVVAVFVPGAGFQPSISTGVSVSVTSVPFTSGNLTVFQADANTTNTTFSIIEVNSTTAGQTGANAVPIAGTGFTPLRTSGANLNTGYLSNSNYGNLVVFTGSRTPNDITILPNVDTADTKAVGAIDATGTFVLTGGGDLPASYNGVVGSDTRGATTIDGATYFISDESGLYTNGATAADPAGFFRGIKAFGGVVYVGQNSTDTNIIQVSTISAPTGGALAGLPGLTNNNAFRDFYLIRSGDNGFTFDVLYVVSNTSATAGTIDKYSLVAGTWVHNGAYTETFGGFGLAAEDEGNGATLYVSTGTGNTTGNSIVKLSDTAGYNQPITITTASNVTLYTAPAGKILKGVAFTPTTVVESAPTVVNPTATAITNSSATLGGTMTTDGNSIVTTYGIVYAPTATNPNPEVGGPGVTVLSNTGSPNGVFSFAASGLSASTGYSFKAFATNAIGTSYSPVGSFSTAANIALPTVNSPTKANISHNSATLGGTVVSDGGDTGNVSYGIVYSLTSANAAPTIGGTGVTQVFIGSGIGAFSGAIGGLLASSGYSYRAYATNSAGTAYSNVDTFTTLQTPSLPTIASPAVANISTTNALFSANITNDGNSTITDRGVVLLPVSAAADPVLGGVGVIQISTAGGTGAFSLVGGGLKPFTAYRFALYATNSLGTSYTGYANFTTESFGLLISSFLANPAGSDSPFEYVELVATRSIDFAQTPYTVVFTNNGTATTNGWIAGGNLTYAFNISTGTVNAGDVVYVGGSNMAPTGTKLRVIDTGAVAGDGFGNAASGGVLGNAGANADSIGVFDLPSSALTSSTVPVDAIFYGAGIGTAVPATGGYTLPDNDTYDGGLLTGASPFVNFTAGNDAVLTASGAFTEATNTFDVARTWATKPATDGRTTIALAAPTITAIAPFSGPTNFAQSVVITGTGFSFVDNTLPSAVLFGGLDATSFVVNSDTQITAFTPLVATPQTVAVTVSNAKGTSTVTPQSQYTYTASAAAPTLSEFTINGGDMYAVNAYGFQVTGLSGKNSIIAQLYVEFDIGVTLGAGAFTLDAGSVTVNIPTAISPVAAGTNVVTIIAEADPTTLDTNGGHKGYRLRFSGSSTYLNTFDNSPTGNGGSGNIFTTLKDGFYKLNIIGANVHAGGTTSGTPMASNVTQGFWTMYASVATDDRDVAGEGHAGTPGDGTSVISVNSSVIGFAATNGFGYGTSLTNYNVAYDWNLDGDVADDLIEFAKRFGAEWSF